MAFDRVERIQEKAPIVSNFSMKGDYWQVDLASPGIAALAQPGQFVHLLLRSMEHRILRRPFSISDVSTNDGIVRIVYKVVGEGTEHLSAKAAGYETDLLGPLGVGFELPQDEKSLPVIVAGGYGCAATYLFAKRCLRPGIALLGGRSAGDILLEEKYAQLGWEVRVSTDDGSQGTKGLVTDLLAFLLRENNFQPFIVACGPNPMLRAVSQMVATVGLDAQVSLDHVMCCGVGACFACVVKLKADNEQGWEYVRTCKDGPVFRASRTYWD